MASGGMNREWKMHRLFSLGFRPFFLLACAWPTLIVPLWALAWLGYPPLAGTLTRDWHVHEMLFGFLSGVIAGFLLTAIPTWTGRPPLCGARLAGLVGLWTAGRLAMVVAPRAAWAATVDAAFLLVLAAFVWREVLAGRNWKNTPVCALVSLLALANIGLDLWPVAPGLADLAERLALAVPALLIALIGGRVVPAFTRNWLSARKVAALPAAPDRFDLAVLVLTGLALAAWIAAPQSAYVGAGLILAGAGALLRLSRWRGGRTLAEPLVWILHKGYAWLGIALALVGASALWPAVAPYSAGVHALTVGAIGVMTLAMMTRAILGHTGRPRTADRGTLAIYLAANLAAVLRVAAAFAPAFAPTAQPGLLGLSAAAWSLAFGGFVWLYGPMLIGPRVDDAPSASA